MDDEETMTECSAAMLLMKLSCSPHSNPALLSSAMLLSQSGTAGHSGSFAGSLPSYPNMPSPVDSSGKEHFHYKCDILTIMVFSRVSLLAALQL